MRNDLGKQAFPVSGIKVAPVPASPPVCETCGKAAASVVIGFCHPELTHAQWQQSKDMVTMRDAYTSHHLIGQFRHFASGAHVATARCRIAKDFLEHPAKPEWLWMQDTDATYGDAILEQLLACADPVRAPIVGALAFGVAPKKGPDGDLPANEVGATDLELFPTLYRMRDDNRLLRMLDYERNAMVPVDATGCHCLLIHRSVLEDQRWDHKHPLPWFRMGSLLKNEEVSEDMFFCLHARQMGYPIFVNTAAKTGHVKTFVADEDMYLRQREREVPPRPRRPLVALIPSRSEANLDALLPVLLAQGGFDRLVVAWNGDPAVSGESFLDGRLDWRQCTFERGIHALWNVAVDEFPGHDVCLLNDDIVPGEEFCARLHAGLYRYRLIAAVCPNYDGRPGVGFEATNDICAGRYDGTGGFAGFAFAVSRDWLAAGGYRFPEECRFWFGDNDFVLSVLRSGFTLGIDHAVTVRHDEDNSTWESEEMAAQLEADKHAFVARWPGVVELVTAEASA